MLDNRALNREHTSRLRFAFGQVFLVVTAAISFYSVGSGLVPPYIGIAAAMAIPLSTTAFTVGGMLRRHPRGELALTQSTGVLTRIFAVLLFVLGILATQQLTAV